MMIGYMVIGVLVLLGFFGYFRRQSQGPVVGKNKRRLRGMNAQSAQTTATDFQWKEWVKLGDLWAYFTPRTGGPQWPILMLATAVLLLVFKDFFFPEGKGVLVPIFWVGIIVVALCSVMLFGSWEDNRYRRLLSLLLFGALVWFVLRHTNLIYESPTERKVAQALSLQLNRELKPVEERAEFLRKKAETEGLTPEEIAELKQLPRQENIKKRHFPAEVPEDVVQRLYKKATAQLEQSRLAGFVKEGGVPSDVPMWALMLLFGGLGGIFLLAVVFAGQRIGESRRGGTALGVIALLIIGWMLYSGSYRGPSRPVAITVLAHEATPAPFETKYLDLARTAAYNQPVSYLVHCKDDYNVQRHEANNWNLPYGATKCWVVNNNDQPITFTLVYRD